MVFMRLPIWPDTAPTSAEKAPVTAAYTCCAAFAIVDTMVEKYPAIEETRPDTSESAEDTSEPTNATTAFTPPETAATTVAIPPPTPLSRRTRLNQLQTALSGLPV